MATRRIVTLTTDFGLEGTFVAQMKGAALAVSPDLVLVDITHEVPPHDVAAGAFLLKTAYAAFPPGTIHVAVVDPGVGTSRRAVAVRTEHFCFVAPDNGILTRVLDEEPPGAAYVLESAHYRSPSASPTFEGRDVFARVAAWIARGTELEHLGPVAESLVRLDLPRVELQPGCPAPIPVVLVDRFGNATLDLPRERLEPFRGADGGLRVRVSTPGGDVSEIRRTYEEPGTGEPFLLFNSADHLEVALRGESAARKLGLAPGAVLSVTVEP